MSEKTALKGLAGMSRAFRSAVEDQRKGDKLLFVGSPFTCLPFAEFLSYSIRDLPFKKYFMPGTDIAKIREIVVEDGYGFKLGGMAGFSSFDLVVLLGGLALPKTHVDPKVLKQELLKVCRLDSVLALFFQGVMKKREWLDEFAFIRLIDNDLTVVTD